MSVCKICSIDPEGFLGFEPKKCFVKQAAFTGVGAPYPACAATALPVLAALLWSADTGNGTVLTLVAAAFDTNDWDIRGCSPVLPHSAPLHRPALHSPALVPSHLGLSLHWVSHSQQPPSVHVVG